MKYLLALISLIVVSSATGQKKGAVPFEMIGTPSGFYIKMNGPVQTDFKIFRKEKDGKYEAIGAYHSVATAADLYQRMTAFSGVFPHFGAINAAFVDTIWNRYQTDRASLSQIPHPLLQLGIGNAYLDTTAILGKTYQYKVAFSESEKEPESKMTVYKLHHPEYGKALLSTINNVGSLVRLEWKVPVSLAPPFFVIYRKQSAGKEGFKQIEVERGVFANETEDSTIFLSIDSTGTPGISYDYFLASVDFLGNEGTHSDTVRLQLGGRQNVPTVHNIRTRSDSMGIFLSWRGLDPNPSLQNILVLRSESYDTGYTLLTTLPVNAYQYLDRNVAGGKRYYYQLIVQGSANFSIPSPRVSGMFGGKLKLDAPYDFASQSVEQGVVLSWRYRSPERIKGFKVYRSLHPQQDFDFIGEMIIPSDSSLYHFTDSTVGNENTTYYYAVAAVSRTSNLGPSSTVVSGNALAALTLEAPVKLRRLWLNDSTVSITWADMQESNPAISGYKIYKSEEELTAVSEQNLCDSVSVNEFTDRLAPGETGWYWVRAICGDQVEGGLSSPIIVRAELKKPLAPEVYLSRQKTGISLSWSASLDKDIQQYRIYRSTGEGELSLLGSLDGNNKNPVFFDEKVQKGNLYFYYVSAVNQYEVESDRSKEVSVRY